MAIDWGALVGGGMGGLTGLIGQNQWNQQSDQYSGMGAPYRDRLAAITADPSAYYNSPEARALGEASDRRYSAQFGNPAGSGTAQAGTLDALMRGYNDERNLLARMGGLDYYNRAATGARGNAINSGQGAMGGLGGMLGSVPWGSIFSGGGGGGSEGFDMFDMMGDDFSME